MSTRTWPYGTVKPVTVHETGTFANGFKWLVCQENDPPREGFLLAGGVGSPARKGQRGKITFVEGGPTGGHWHYESLVSK